MRKRLSWLALLGAGVVLAASAGELMAADTGGFSGQFVLDGAIPNLKPPVITKDAAVCAAKKLPENTLIVDPKTKGIANIVVYLKKAPSDIPRTVRASKKKQVVFDQKNCRFEPHVLLVRTDQEVLVKSDDPVNHNTHTHPFRNEELNFIVKPKDREGFPIQYNQPEFLPMPVNCDLHPHMKAYWMVLDHPYMAVTDSEGKFKIENLPEGEYTFTVWHERVGYIDRALKVDIFAGETEKLDPIAVPVSKFKLD